MNSLGIPSPDIGCFWRDSKSVARKYNTKTLSQSVRSMTLAQVSHHVPAPNQQKESCGRPEGFNLSVYPWSCPFSLMDHGDSWWMVDLARDSRQLAFHVVRLGMPWWSTNISIDYWNLTASPMSKPAEDGIPIHQTWSYQKFHVLEPCFNIMKYIHVGHEPPSWTYISKSSRDSCSPQWRFRRTMSATLDFHLAEQFRSILQRGRCHSKRC